MSNEEKIFNLVKNHFYLDTNSLSIIEKLLLNKEERLKYIPEEVISHLDENLRFSIKLKKERYQDFDKGWKLFRQEFISSGIISNIGIDFVSYTDFYENKILVNKNEQKLFKFLKKEIKKSAEAMCGFFAGKGYSVKLTDFDDKEERVRLVNDFDKSFTKLIEEIGTVKMSKGKNLYLTVSYNYADWFLCATAEEWKSCLNLESEYSECYWTGLPGIFPDSNRAIVYLTNKEEKSYEGITSEKMLMRFWSILNNNNQYNIGRTYPSNLLCNSDIASILNRSTFPITFHEEELSISKNEIPIIRDAEGESIFIYLDNLCITNIQPNGFSLAWGSSGFYCLDSYNNFTEKRMRYTKGLKYLINNNTSLEHESQGCECYECGDSISEDDCIYGLDSHSYCERCFDQVFSYCQTCEDAVWADDAHYYDCEGPFCACCFNEHFQPCNDCGNIYETDQLLEVDDSFICESCASDAGAMSCDNCHCLTTNYYQVGDEVFCEDCLTDNTNKCSKCEKLCLKQETVLIDNKECCKDCADELQSITIKCPECNNYTTNSIPFLDDIYCDKCLYDKLNQKNKNPKEEK